MYILVQVKPTKLMALNKDIDLSNTKELKELSGEEFVYEANDKCEPLDNKDKEELSNHKFFDECLTQQSLTLRVGAQVCVCVCVCVCMVCVYMCVCVCHGLRVYAGSQNSYE